MINPSTNRYSGRPAGRPVRFLLAVVSVVLAGLIALPAAAADADSTRLLVGFEPGAAPRDRAAALEPVGGEVIRGYRLVPGLRLVEVPAGTRPSEAIAGLRLEPDVAFVSADRAMRIDRSANDPLLGGQWGMTDIRAPDAWEVTTGSADVEVAVLDSGMDLDHPDLAGNLWTNPDEIPANGLDDDGNGYRDDVHGWDFVNGDNDPSDDNGHGTHTAGTVGAVGNNGIGVAGVAWDVSLVPLKVCSGGGFCEVSDAIGALDYAVREGIPISNNSYGFSGVCPAALSAGLEAAGSAGHLFVASAGNNGTDSDVVARYPSACPEENVVSVAWMASASQRANSSTFGRTTVDLGAPGSLIESTTRDGSYGQKSGTSMAAPHVAGTAALLKSINPTWGWEATKERILGTVREVCGLQVLTGGVLDAGAAVAAEVDTAPPCPEKPVIASGPETRTNSASATFTFSGDPGNALRCRLDAGPWTDCTSPASYSALGEGQHTFRVVQVAGGSRESEPASWTWTVDRTPPSAPTVSLAPSSPTRETSATFTFTGEASAEFECRLDGGPATACTSPFQVANLAEGPHSVTIFQTDRAGNRSSGTVRTWTVDSVAPAAPVIGDGPPPDTRSRSATVGFTGEAGATARCRLDIDGVPGTWATCSSPVVFEDLADAAYRLEVVLRDKAGNQSDPAVGSWTVDNGNPARPVISAGPTSGWSGSNLEVRFSGEPGATFECRLDLPGTSGSWAGCSSPFTAGPLTEGPHGFAVRQTDAAGNSSEPNSIEFGVDTVPPGPPSVTGGPSGPVSTDRAEFGIASGPDATAECRLASGGQPGEWHRCPEDGVWTDLDQGPKTLSIRAVDRAGNPSTEVERSWTVDTIAPEAPGLAGVPTGATTSRSISASLSTEPGATATCQLDERATQACGGELRFDGLADGSHVLTAFQTDAAGNRSPMTVAIWVIDNRPPAAPSVSGPSGPTGSTSPRFLLDGVEGVFECRFGEGDWASCPSPFETGDIPDGFYRAWFRQVDPAGNRSPVVGRSWTVDTAAPRMLSAFRRSSGASTFRLTVKGVDAGTGPGALEVSFSAEMPGTRADRRVRWSGGSVVRLGSSPVPFWVRAVDRAGNRSDWLRLKTR